MINFSHALGSVRPASLPIPLDPIDLLAWADVELMAEEGIGASVDNSRGRAIVDAAIDHLLGDGKRACPLSFGTVDDYLIGVCGDVLEEPGK